MTELDRFKPVFKYYKRRLPPPDLSDLVSPARIDSGCRRRQPPLTTTFDDAQLKSLCLNSVSDWRIVEFAERPGLLHLSNVFDGEGAQIRWAESMLRLGGPPNRTNLDDGPVGDDEKLAVGRLSRLRWITLGYHYDWAEKAYREECWSPFPNDLAVLSEGIATTLGFESFRAETAIVNVYQEKSTLGGHVDNLEWCLEAPLFTFSFGQSAVFLSGGQTRAESPMALLLAGGEILVLADQQRTVYHAVPRILIGDDSRFDETKQIGRYLNRHRINVSVRQLKEH